MANNKDKDPLSSLLNKAAKAVKVKSGSDKQSAAKGAAASSSGEKKVAASQSPARQGASKNVVKKQEATSQKEGVKQAKSEQQQKKDVASLGKAVAAAGAALSAAASAKNKGKSKKGVNFLILLLCLALFATGVMYYFDIPPLDFALGGFDFKYYTYGVGEFEEGELPLLEEGELKIHFIDVGQGDCIFIQFPDGKTMLIDGGENRNAVASGITSYLLELGEEKITIDYLMLTHCDSDHCGSLDAVIAHAQIDVINVYQPRVYSKYENDPLKSYVAQNGMDNAQGDWSNVPTISTGVYASFVEAVYLEMQELGDAFGEIYYNFEGMTIEGVGWSIYLYNPAEEMYGSLSSAKAKNNISPVMVLCYGGNKILLTGDADEKAEQNFVANLTALDFNDGFSWDGDCDVLKVGHHGGAESTLPAFLQTVKPEYAVISAGENNKYGHPRQDTLDRLKQYGAQKVFVTRDCGSIVLTVKSDGTFSWKCSVGENPIVFSSLYILSAKIMCYNLINGGLINPLSNK